jgi:hypothetical protein
MKKMTMKMVRKKSQQYNKENKSNKARRKKLSEI